MLNDSNLMKCPFSLRHKIFLFKVSPEQEGGRQSLSWEGLSCAAVDWVRWYSGLGGYTAHWMLKVGCKGSRLGPVEVKRGQHQGLIWGSYFWRNRSKNLYMISFPPARSPFQVTLTNLHQVANSHPPSVAIAAIICHVSQLFVLSV